MQLGVTLLGGASSGLQSGAGITAACTAQASGWAEVTRLGFGSAALSFSVSSTAATKTHYVASPAINCTATVSAVAAVTYTAVNAAAPCSATVSASPTALYSCYGTVDCTATGTSYGFRQAKTRVLPATMAATLEAEAQIYEIAYPEEAIATATGFGTTYHLTYGSAYATAVITDTAEHQKGSTGSAIAVCTAEPAICVHQKGAAGLAEAVASASIDSVVTRGGVVHHDGNGEAICVITAEPLYVSIYQPQNGYAFATGSEAVPRMQIGAKGVALATASTVGSDGFVYGTGATADVGDARTTCVAKPSVTFKGTGTASCGATGSGDALVKQTRAETVAAVSTAGCSVPAPIRLRLVYANAMCQASVTSKVYKTTLALVTTGQAKATAAALSTQIDIQTSSALAESELHARAYKTSLGEGIEAVAPATCSGYVWVNQRGPGDGFNEASLARAAPDERTVFISSQSRTVIVSEQLRRIAA